MAQALAGVFLEDLRKEVFDVFAEVVWDFGFLIYELVVKLGSVFVVKRRQADDHLVEKGT